MTFIIVQIVYFFLALYLSAVKAQQIEIKELEEEDELQLPDDFENMLWAFL